MTHSIAQQAPLPPPPYADFAARFEQARLAAGAPAPQAKLALLLGVAPTTVWTWRHGRALPSIEAAVRIAERLDVCVEWLLTGRGPVQPLPRDIPTELAQLLADLPPRRLQCLRSLLLDS